MVLLLIALNAVRADGVVNIRVQLSGNNKALKYLLSVDALLFSHSSSVTRQNSRGVEAKSSCSSVTELWKLNNIWSSRRCLCWTSDESSRQ